MDVLSECKCDKQGSKNPAPSLEIPGVTGPAEKKAAGAPPTSKASKEGEDDVKEMFRDLMRMMTSVKDEMADVKTGIAEVKENAANTAKELKDLKDEVASDIQRVDANYRGCRC